MNLLITRKADVYYENVAKSLQHALDVMRTDASFRPLEQFKKENTALLQIPLDRIIFLSGTLDAANNRLWRCNQRGNMLCSLLNSWRSTGVLHVLIPCR